MACQAKHHIDAVRSTLGKISATNQEVPVHEQRSNCSKLNAKKICGDCVGEKYLSEEIAKEGRRGKCSVLRRDRQKRYRLGALSGTDRVPVFQSSTTPRHVRPARFLGTLDAKRTREMGYEWYRHGEPVVDAIMKMRPIFRKRRQAMSSGFSRNNIPTMKRRR